MEEDFEARMRERNAEMQAQLDRLQAEKQRCVEEVEAKTQEIARMQTMMAEMGHKMKEMKTVTAVLGEFGAFYGSPFFKSSPRAFNPMVRFPQALAERAAAGGGADDSVTAMLNDVPRTRVQKRRQSKSDRSG